ncbi:MULTISPECIES: hypothetical protein [Cupriavidus]|uniref:Uncharacterized protein n=1 Tax=Cupriavidus pauculus TaxID=82633 RepID=A0A3G8GWI1_9BURK|nr:MULTISPECIES: hypothetical protein [Cupriavidus]AZG12454.1 hypothetical protein EHF44_02870 [Cupriavidus pauculus]MDT6960684.1 hypothetical protein [Cupriavidus sp. SZY C1]
MSEKTWVRLRTFSLLCLLLAGTVAIYALRLDPRPWDCGSAERTLAGAGYVLEVCSLPDGPAGHPHEARLRVYDRLGRLLAHRSYHFAPWSPANKFDVGDNEIRYTDAAQPVRGGTFELHTLTFPPTSADRRAANFVRWFLDR